MESKKGQERNVSGIWGFYLSIASASSALLSIVISQLLVASILILGFLSDSSKGSRIVNLIFLVPFILILLSVLSAIAGLIFSTAGMIKASRKKIKSDRKKTLAGLIISGIILLAYLAITVGSLIIIQRYLPFL